MSELELNPGAAYGDVRDELIRALAVLTHSEGQQTVPSCPAWTVRDVVAHLTGLNAEKIAGVPGSLGSDEATTRQVADRIGKTLPEIVDEWQSVAEPVRDVMAADAAAATAFLADLVIHVYDVAEVLGQPTASAAAATPSSAARYVPLLQARATDRVGVALAIDLIDGERWAATPDSTQQQLTLRATSHDFLRSVTGRRTRAQVEALEWSSDPAVLLDNAWNQYGTFRAAP